MYIYICICVYYITYICIYNYMYMYMFAIFCGDKCWQIFHTWSIFSGYGSKFSRLPVFYQRPAAHLVDPLLGPKLTST